MHDLDVTFLNRQLPSFRDVQLGGSLTTTSAIQHPRFFKAVLEQVQQYNAPARLEDSCKRSQRLGRLQVRDATPGLNSTRSTLVGSIGGSGCRITMRNPRFHARMLLPSPAPSDHLFRVVHRDHLLARCAQKFATACLRRAQIGNQPLAHQGEAVALPSLPRAAGIRRQTYAAIAFKVSLRNQWPACHAPRAGRCHRASTSQSCPRRFDECRGTAHGFSLSLADGQEVGTDCSFLTTVLHQASDSGVQAGGYVDCRPCDDSAARHRQCPPPARAADAHAVESAIMEVI